MWDPSCLQCSWNCSVPNQSQIVLSQVGKGWARLDVFADPPFPVSAPAPVLAQALGCSGLTRWISGHVFSGLSKYQVVKAKRSGNIWNSPRPDIQTDFFLHHCCCEAASVPVTDDRGNVFVLTPMIISALHSPQNIRNEENTAAFLPCCVETLLW